MQLKKLRETQEHLSWPSDSNDLPIISWESYLEQAQKRPLIVVAGFIHDVSDFQDEHPGGRHFLVKNYGKDATTAFFGGVYDHSNAAHNVCLSHSFHRDVCLPLLIAVARNEARWCSPRWHGTRFGRQGRPAFTTAPHCALQRDGLTLRFVCALANRG